MATKYSRQRGAAAGAVVGALFGIGQRLLDASFDWSIPRAAAIGAVAGASAGFVFPQLSRPDKPPRHE
ncbi:hypothetical protein OG418_48740 [Streptomyces phaeochromogenes]|uniref:hypothetical protein n=1 Tax=Streptomyces phaeochromogenes TaxID=1923 RepID=UPI002E0FC8AA|nr:hypothetical protein OG437_50265 [Streptomyces phaeochromogenes]